MNGCCGSRLVYGMCECLSLCDSSDDSMFAYVRIKCVKCCQFADSQVLCIFLILLSLNHVRNHSTTHNIHTYNAQHAYVYGCRAFWGLYLYFPDRGEHIFQSFSALVQRRLSEERETHNQPINSGHKSVAAYGRKSALGATSEPGERDGANSIAFNFLRAFSLCLGPKLKYSCRCQCNTSLF